MKIISISVCAAISAFMLIFSAPFTAKASVPTDGTVPITDKSKNNQFTAEYLANWVLEANPGIAALTEAAEVAILRIEPAGALDDPRLTYLAAPATLGGGNRRFNNNGLNQKIEITQKFPWPGTLKARKRTAIYNANAAKQNVSTKRLLLAAKAKEAYAEWYFIKQAIAIHRATHSRVIEYRAVAEAKYAAGTALQQDTLQAELEQVNLDRHFLELKRIEASVKAQINALLNRPPNTHIPAPMAPKRATHVPAMQVLEELMSNGHPELKNLEAKRSARKAEVTLAKKAFYPDITVSAGYNNIWDDPDKRTTIGFSINVPLDRSKRRAKLNSAKADVRRIQAQHRDQYTFLMGQLASTHAELQEAIDAVALYEKSILPLVNEYVQATLSDYQSGSGNFLSVIAAEQKRLATERDYERNRANVLRHQAHLERWVGTQLGNYHAKVSGVQP